jgi:hypothetical protein
VKDRAVLDDLSTICEFEITLRNALPWKEQVRRVTDHRGGVWPSLDPDLLDDTFTHIERLVRAVAALRDALNVEATTPSGGGRSGQLVVSNR